MPCPAQGFKRFFTGFKYHKGVRGGTHCHDGPALNLDILNPNCEDTDDEEVRNEEQEDDENGELPLDGLEVDEDGNRISKQSPLGDENVCEPLPKRRRLRGKQKVQPEGGTITPPAVPAPTPPCEFGETIEAEPSEGEDMSGEE